MARAIKPGRFGVIQMIQMPLTIAALRIIAGALLDSARAHETAGRHSAAADAFAVLSWVKRVQGNKDAQQTYRAEEERCRKMADAA